MKRDQPELRIEFVRFSDESTGASLYTVNLGGPIMADTPDVDRALIVWRKAIQQNPRLPLRFWDGDGAVEHSITADGEVIA